jgi:hypothetical protein
VTKLVQREAKGRTPGCAIFIPAKEPFGTAVTIRDAIMHDDHGHTLVPVTGFLLVGL